MTYRHGWTRYRVYYAGVELACVKSMAEAEQVIRQHKYRKSDKGWPKIPWKTRRRLRKNEWLFSRVGVEGGRGAMGRSWSPRDNYYIREDRNDGTRCDKRMTLGGPKNLSARRCGRPVGHNGGCKSYQALQNENDRKKHRERVDELAKHLGYE